MKRSQKFQNFASKVLSEKMLFERLISSSFEGILAFDLKCRYTVWNLGMERISGLDRKDALGRCALEAYYSPLRGTTKIFRSSGQSEAIKYLNRMDMQEVN